MHGWINEQMNKRREKLSIMFCIILAASVAMYLVNSIWRHVINAFIQHDSVQKIVFVFAFISCLYRGLIIVRLVFILRFLTGHGLSA